MSNDSDSAICGFIMLHYFNVGDKREVECFKTPCCPLRRLEVIIFIDSVHCVPEVTTRTFLAHPPCMSCAVFWHFRTVVEGELVVAEFCISFFPGSIIISCPSLCRTNKIDSLCKTNIPQCSCHRRVGLFFRVQMIMTIAANPTLFF